MRRRGKRADHADNTHCCIIDETIGWTKSCSVQINITELNDRELPGPKVILAAEYYEKMGYLVNV